MPKLRFAQRGSNTLFLQAKIAQSKKKVPQLFVN